LSGRDEASSKREKEVRLRNTRRGEKIKSRENVRTRVKLAGRYEFEIELRSWGKRKGAGGGGCVVGEHGTSLIVFYVQNRREGGYQFAVFEGGEGVEGGGPGGRGRGLGGKEIEGTVAQLRKTPRSSSLKNNLERL